VFCGVQYAPHTSMAGFLATALATDGTSPPFESGSLILNIDNPMFEASVLKNRSASASGNTEPAHASDAPKPRMD
jgi:hypothetical protein